MEDNSPPTDVGLRINALGLAVQFFTDVKPDVEPEKVTAAAEAFLKFLRGAV